MDILCDFLSPTFYPPNFYPQANSQIALVFTGSKKSHFASKYDFLPPKRQKCNAGALTTGDLSTAYNLHSTSTIEWSRPHSHAPDSGKIGTIGVRESMKTDTVISTRIPHKIVADGLLES